MFRINSAMVDFTVLSFPVLHTSIKLALVTNLFHFDTTLCSTRRK